LARGIVKRERIFKIESIVSFLRGSANGYLIALHPYLGW
jgi:hypothetical protein